MNDDHLSAHKLSKWLMQNNKSALPGLIIEQHNLLLSLILHAQ